VRHIMNVTDVDDKTIHGAHQEQKTLAEFTRPYEAAFKEDLKKLNIMPPFRFTRATEHIKDMTKLIEKLLRRGIAYEKDGSVYFDISQFSRYGRLSRLNQKGMRAGVRIDADEYEKDAVQDFVLWKAVKKDEPTWKTPFGEGRPGWHIECSAMASHYLNQPFDIHSGGVDLIFPHHENEIAQSEAAEKKQFARWWLHGEHLLADGKKMSKSLGNFWTLRDIVSRGFSPLAFRYLILTAHYRSKMNFTWASLKSAAQSLEKLYEFIRELKKKKRGAKSKKRGFEEYKKKFDAAMFGDLDTAKALTVIWNLIRDYRKNSERYNPHEILDLCYRFDKILGLDFKKVQIEKIPAPILKLAALREQLRKKQEWKNADAVRDELKKNGYHIEDSPQGPIVKRV
jgi:cysteinyl-tRNA synthetase